MLIPSSICLCERCKSSLSRRVNANSQREELATTMLDKLIKKGEC